jgi:two-component system sensor histidine kinase KdpD
MQSMAMRARALLERAGVTAGSLRSVVARHGLLSALLAVASATAVFVPFRDSLSREQWGWPYMLVVGSVAALAGIGPALLSGALAFLAWNFFFFPPYYTLLVAQSGDLVHLSGFLLVAVTVGWQTGRLREREAAALREERHLSAINRLSARLVSDDSEDAMGRAVAEEVATIVNGALAAVWTFGTEGNAVLSHVPPTDVPVVILERLALGARDEALVSLREGRLPQSIVERVALPVHAGRPGGADAEVQVMGHALCASGQVEGVLQVLLPGEAPRPDSHDAASLASAAFLVAAFLRTRRLSSVAMHAAAEREAERLRNALVSSVSHELKTPLASITAAVTDLLDPEVQRTPEEYVGMLGLVAEDLNRLDSAIADLLDVSRLEAQAWRPRPDEYDLGEVLGDVISRIHPSARARIGLEIEEDMPLVFVDFAQMARAVGHVLDNALQYSVGQVIMRASAEEGARVVLEIEDSGPGISGDDLPFVFDKFYRGASGRTSRSSTGLGLAITREIVTANKAEISIQHVRPHGTRFFIAFPVKEEG